MRSIKALELLNNGKIEELRSALQDDIYQDSLKSNSSAKKRYAAMKRYFTYRDNDRVAFQKPGEVEIDGKQYNSFTNSWSLVLTQENCGEIEKFSADDGTYPDVGRLLRFDGIKKKIDFNDVIAQAKRRGYKLNKKEVGAGFKYLMYSTELTIRSV